MQHTLFKFLYSIKHIRNQERDIIIHVILKKKKIRHKIKYFAFLEFFNVFGFFLNNQNNPKKK